MGPVATAVLLSMLLEPAFLLIQEPPGPVATDPTPHLNLKFDPWTMTLCWDCGGDTTAVGCQILHKEEGPVTIKLAEKPCSHSFWNFVLHAGITFNVTAIAGQRQIAERLSFTNAGQEGTAAQSFSCFIYNVNFMNCSWTKGPAAPDDVQYFLYVQDSKKQWGRECPHYVRESGTHVGCHVPDVSSWASQAYFLVNGTSRHAKIQFFDSFLWLKTIERCNPPGNISVLCNATHCRILWEKPRTRRRLSDRDFQYQLQVQQEDDVERAKSQLVSPSPDRKCEPRSQPAASVTAPEKRLAAPGGDRIELPGDLGNKYHLLSPQPRAAHTLRIRAADTRVLQWSAWSQPVTFGSQESGGRFVYVYVLVVLGTVVCVLAVSCLIQRLCRGRRLFPPIPQIKDKLNDSHQPDQVLWETLAPAAGKEDVEDLLTMEEVAEPTAGTSDAATSPSP